MANQKRKKKGTITGCEQKKKRKSKQKIKIISFCSLISLSLCLPVITLNPDHTSTAAAVSPNAPLRRRRHHPFTLGNTSRLRFGYGLVSERVRSLCLLLPIKMC